MEFQEDTVMVNEFVPNEEVHRYFQVSDAILTSRTSATPSGVESLATEMPVLATRVGHFPRTVNPQFNGYLAEPEDIDSMADDATVHEQPIKRENVGKAAERMSWKTMRR